MFTGELAQAGIGQNVIAVTPLQVLNAYAAVANGGSLMRPMIVRGETDATGKLVREYAPEVIRTIAADPSTLQTMRIGAREVITSGHAYNIRDLRLPGALSGKTGTAEFGEPTAEGTLPFHSWFVAYLPSAAGRDRCGAGGRDVQLLGRRAGQRLGRGRQVLPPAPLRPRPGPAPRSRTTSAS